MTHYKQALVQDLQGRQFYGWFASKDLKKGPAGLKVLEVYKEETKVRCEDCGRLHLVDVLTCWCEEKEQKKTEAKTRIG